ncbi:universal stress protein [Flaviaesturariibacter amylovorans]|uniref:UspA domain-containing protein n=1 Tax=Flaviaesturariibacter amylovorans TaxID=1084520 RepID=A0ABP8GUN8_9BACT
MKTVVVPVDFSENSLATARYAVNMLSGIPEVNTVLYHMYEKANEEEEAYFRLEAMKTELSNVAVATISCHAEPGSDFPESLSRFARHWAASLIVMGLTGKTKLGQIFMTGNTLKLVEKNPCPVMVIPPQAEFTKINNVALTSDFRDVDLTTPVGPIKQVLELFRPALHIVNVNSEHYVALSEHFLEQKARMNALFSDFKPEFYFIGTYDFHETINQFVSDKQIDMVITIPRSHSFIDKLFNPNHTKKLVFSSTVPVLAAHE